MRLPSSQKAGAPNKDPTPPPTSRACKSGRSIRALCVSGPRRSTTPANSWRTLGRVDGIALIIRSPAPSLPDEHHALLFRYRLGIHPGAPPLFIGSSRPSGVTRVYSPGPRDRPPPRGGRGPQPSAIEKGPPRTVRLDNWVNKAAGYPVSRACWQLRGTQKFPKRSRQHERLVVMCLLRMFSRENRG